jgi:hypothetical protein
VRTPLQGEGLLPRLRVFSKLDELASKHPFLAIVAGPGYGKTSIASDWIRQQSQPHCWLTLAPDEEDPHSLLLYLRAAVLEIDPRLDTERLDSILRQGLASGRWRAAMDAFLSLPLWAEKPVWLVLDDLHCLKDEALSAIDYLLRFRPNSLRILATTRRTPELPYWSRLVLQGQTGVLSASDLAFCGEDLHGCGLPEQLLPANGRLAFSCRPGPPRPFKPASRVGGGTATRVLGIAGRAGARSVRALFRPRFSIGRAVPADLSRSAGRSDFGTIAAPWRSGSTLEPASSALHPLFLEFVRRRLERDQRQTGPYLSTERPAALVSGSASLGFVQRI